MVNRGYISRHDILAANGLDTILESAAFWQGMVQTYLMRWVRIGGAALFEWVGEIAVGWVERSWEMHQERKRDKFEFYTSSTATYRLVDVYPVLDVPHNSS